MRVRLVLIGMLIIAVSFSAADAKIHTTTFGKWMTVQWFGGTDESQPIPLKVRGLYVDERLREYVSGAPHEITDRLFVAQRMYRLNDSLPGESGASPCWRWERGGWLLVDRLSGHVSPLNLPNFDPVYSSAAWYRDYVAYCGISDDGKKGYAIVVQVGRRKPILKKSFDGKQAAVGESPCVSPEWQRQPARVSFTERDGQILTYSVGSHSVDMASDDDEEEASE